MKTKLTIAGFVALVVAALALSLFSYCQGKKVGVATNNMAHTTQEVSQLEDEKGDINKAIHALDTDALRTRILDLSGRVHKQATLIHPTK